MAVVLKAMKAADETAAVLSVAEEEEQHFPELSLLIAPNSQGRLIKLSELQFPTLVKGVIHSDYILNDNHYLFDPEYRI